MIELGVQPGVEIVTALAIGGCESRTGTGVRWIGGALPSLQVAGVALRGKAIQDPSGGLFVTFLARYGGMGTEQRETVLVILDLLDRDFPAFYSVALRAVGTHLTAVHIGVAIRAVLPSVGENRFAVTLHAWHFLVQTAQRVFGFVMVEFGYGSNWAPTRRGMTVFARDV